VLPLALRDVVEDAGLRQRQFLTSETLKRLPVSGALVAARAEPIVPSPLGMLEHHCEPLEGATSTLGVGVAPQFGTYRPILLVERGMAVCTTPCPALVHTPPQAFPDRLALDAPVSLACLAPRVGKSENVKCPRAPCRWVAAWRPLDRNQRRFLRLTGEAATGEALRQDVQNPAGSGFARTADDKIIGKATQKTSALHPGGTSWPTHASRP
jgi:hypothetical protein